MGLVLGLVHLVLRLVDQLSDRHRVMHAEALLLVHLSHLSSGSRVRFVVWGGLEGRGGVSGSDCTRIEPWARLGLGGLGLGIGLGSLAEPASQLRPPAS